MATGEGSGMRTDGGRARDGRERERKRGELDLIDKVDLSATRGCVYVHLASFFRLRPLARDPRSSGTIRFLHDPTLSAT